MKSSTLSYVMPSTAKKRERMVDSFDETSAQVIQHQRAIYIPMPRFAGVKKPSRQPAGHIMFKPLMRYLKT